MVAVLCRINDICEEFLTLGDGRPKQLKNGTRHIRVANQIMLFAYAFRFVIPGDFQKRMIGIGDPALQISLAYNQIVAVKMDLFP